MSDKSNKYGYVGVDIPAQSFGANKGVFNPAEINELVADNKWTQYGQLELIQTQEVTSSTAALDFTSIEESTYNVHFMTFTKFKPIVDGNVLQLQFSTNGGSSFSTSGYHYAFESGRSTGSFFDNNSTSFAGIRVNGNQGTASNENSNGYIYFYNLGDSSKHSFVTSHNMSWTRTPEAEFWLGGGVDPNAQTVNAIRLVGNTGNIDTVIASLYGIKEYS